MEKISERELPIFVSEWGGSYQNENTLDFSAARAFSEYLKEKNISWCYWSLCNKPENFRCCVVTECISSESKWCRGRLQGAARRGL